MRHGQPEQIRMGDDAAGSAGRAAREILIRVMKTIAAERGHGLAPDPRHGGEGQQQRRVDNAFKTGEMRQPLLGR